MPDCIGYFVLIGGLLTWNLLPLFSAAVYMDI